VKNKFEVVFKKLQSYSFIIFMALIVVTFVVLAAVNQSRKVDDDPQTGNTTENTAPVGQDPDPDPDPGEVVDVTNEKFILPLAHADVTILREFWELNLPVEEQVNAIIKIGNRYQENKGWSLSVDKVTPFNVLASLSGEVIEVDTDPDFGQYVVIQHELGIKTKYYSLNNVSVTVGQEVDQGDVIAEAGSNFDEDSGIHVYFEVVKGNRRLNPNDMIGNKLKDVAN